MAPFLLVQIISSPSTNIIILSPLFFHKPISPPTTTTQSQLILKPINSGSFVIQSLQISLLRCPRYLNSSQLRFPRILSSPIVSDQNRHRPLVYVSFPSFKHSHTSKIGSISAVKETLSDSFKICLWLIALWTVSSSKDSCFVQSNSRDSSTHVYSVSNKKLESSFRQLLNKEKIVAFASLTQSH